MIVGLDRYSRRVFGCGFKSIEYFEGIPRVPFFALRGSPPPLAYPRICLAVWPGAGPVPTALSPGPSFFCILNKLRMKISKPHTSLPKQDPAAYGFTSLGQRHRHWTNNIYQRLRERSAAVSCVAPLYTRGLQRTCGFWTMLVARMLRINGRDLGFDSYALRAPLLLAQ
jgi:hypothetical protein